LDDDKSIFRIRKIAVVDIRGHEEHRELLFQALGGTYALQYRTMAAPF
jgi:hypothetical protein